MPNVFSRFAADTLGLKVLPAECCEISHLWRSNCALAIWDPFLPSWYFCLKTYGSLYALKALFGKSGRFDRVDWKRVLISTIRSSAFLTTTEILFMYWLCIFRRALGFATIPTISFLNGFAACIISIWIETKHRRGMLVTYLLNLASETLYRQAQSRLKIRRPIPHGQSILFGLSTSLMLVILNRPAGPRSIKSASFLRSLFLHIYGAGTNPDRKKQASIDAKKMDYNPLQKALSLSIRNGSISFGAIFLFKIVPGILKRGMLELPSKNLLQTLRLPAFLASLPLLQQAFCFFFSRVSILTCRATLRQSFCVGVSSTLAMALFFPNNTLALQSFWKCIDLCYFNFADAGLLPVIPCADALLFASLSSYLLGVAVLEPHALRPSYYKFLCSLTGDKLQLFNRPLFDCFFGTQSCSVLYKNYVPVVMPLLRSINPSLYTLHQHL